MSKMYSIMQQENHPNPNNYMYSLWKLALSMKIYITRDVVILHFDCFLHYAVLQTAMSTVIKIKQDIHFIVSVQTYLCTQTQKHLHGRIQTTTNVPCDHQSSRLKVELWLCISEVRALIESSWFLSSSSTISWDEIDRPYGLKTQGESTSTKPGF